MWAERNEGVARVGALGMVKRLEVQVLCGACRRQPRVEGNCTRRPSGKRTTVSLPRGRVGWKPDANRSTERK